MAPLPRGPRAALPQGRRVIRWRPLADTSAGIPLVIRAPVWALPGRPLASAGGTAGVSAGAGGHEGPTVGRWWARRGGATSRHCSPLVEPLVEPRGQVGYSRGAGGLFAGRSWGIAGKYAGKFARHHGKGGRWWGMPGNVAGNIRGAQGKGRGAAWAPGGRHPSR